MFFTKKEPEELNALRSEVERLKAENEQLLALTKFSQEEIIVVVDLSKNIAMQNDKAKEMIKDPQRLASALNESMESISMDGCQGSVRSRRLSNQCVAYSIIKSDIRNAKEKYQSILRRYGFLDAVWCASDGMALAVYEEETGLTHGKNKVIIGKIS